MLYSVLQTQDKHHLKSCLHQLKPAPAQDISTGRWHRRGRRRRWRGWWGWSRSASSCSCSFQPPKQSMAAGVFSKPPLIGGLRLQISLFWVDHDWSTLQGRLEVVARSDRLLNSHPSTSWPFIPWPPEPLWSVQEEPHFLNPLTWHWV